MYRLDLATGELVKEIENPGSRGGSPTRTSWSACAVAPLPDGAFDVLVRDAGDDEWRPLLQVPAEDATSTDAVAFSGDGRVAAHDQLRRR